MKPDLDALERRLGRHFKDRSLLARALVTPACHADRPGIPDNQRLEFLGDAVFGLLAADALYAARPDEAEGPLTVRRTHLVSGAVMAEIAEGLGLRDFLELNKGAPPLPPRSAALADALEAVMGATWLDGGLDAARAFFDRLDFPVEDGFDEWRANPKGQLQVKAQAVVPPARPVYETLFSKGPPHKPVVRMRVTVKGLGSAEAEAVGAHAAEVAAAEALLKKLKNVVNHA